VAKVRKRFAKKPLGLTPKELEATLKALPDDATRRSVAALLSLALIRVHVTDEAIKKLIDQQAFKLIESKSPWSSRAIELLKAILYGAAGSGLFELFKHWLAAPAPKEPPKGPRLSDYRRVVMQIERLDSGENGRESFLAMESLRKSEAGKVAAQLDAPADDIWRFLNQSKEVDELISKIDRGVTLAFLRSGHEILRLDFEGRPIATIRLVTAISSQRPDRDQIEETAAAVELELQADNLKVSDFEVDLSSCVPISWQEYHALRG
jgi:hypothetical protein